MYQMEEKWYSICCSAPPLYNLDILEDMDTIGICMNCREHTSFEQWNKEDNDE